MTRAHLFRKSHFIPHFVWVSHSSCFYAKDAVILLNIRLAFVICEFTTFNGKQNPYFDTEYLSKKSITGKSGDKIRQVQPRIEEDDFMKDNES